MTASKARRLARLDEITEDLARAEAEREEAATLARELLAEGATIVELTGRPYSRAWLQNVRSEMKRRGEIQ